MSTLRIRDIGNSLGVIIPKTYSDSLGLKAGKEVTIEMKEGASKKFYAIVLSNHVQI